MQKRIFSAIIFVILISASTFIYASGDGSGYYTGLMLGPTTTGSNTGSSNSKTSLAGRFFLGYETNPNFGYEGGLSIYPQSVSSAGCTAANQRNLYFDVLLKAALPLTGGVGPFTKVGAATPIYIPGLSSCKSGTAAQLYPSITLGVTADLAENQVLDLSWNRLVFGGSIKYIDFYAIGFTYHFNWS